MRMRLDAGSLGIALANFLFWVPGQRGLAICVVFAVASGVCCACVVVLDACSVLAGQRTVLALTHGWRLTSKNVAIWFVGALIAAALGMVARIFEPTPLSALVVAVSWRTVLNKLLAIAKHGG